MTQSPATIRLTPQALAARRRRNVWIALGLVAFMTLVFVTTVLRLTQNQQAAREARAVQAGAAAPARPVSPAPVQGDPVP